MQINFKDRTIERLCLEQRQAQKDLGKSNARKLRARMADLYAVHDPTDLVAGHPHPLKGDREGQFAVSLHGGLRLCFEPYENPYPRKPDGSVDWSQVTSIVIVWIGDYHD